MRRMETGLGRGQICGAFGDVEHMENVQWLLSENEKWKKDDYGKNGKLLR